MQRGRPTHIAEWNGRCNVVAEVAVSFTPGAPVSKTVSYAVAEAATLLVALTRWALDPWLQEQAILLPFTLAVLAAAVVGGLGPGLTAAALSMLISALAFFAPRGSLVVDSTSDMLSTDWNRRSRTRSGSSATSSGRTIVSTLPRNVSTPGCGSGRSEETAGTGRPGFAC